jgi:hypothetical protein
VNARRAVAVLAVAALAACESGGTGTDPGVQASLALIVALEPGLASAADAGTLHLEGPTPKTVSMTPGQTLTIDNLLPGSYTVTLEAFSGGRLESLAETTTSVTAGQNRTVSLTLRSFVPTGLSVPGEVSAGDPVSVTWSSVQGATGYVVEWADNPQFTNAQSLQTDATNATLTLATQGTWQVRVSARNRFGSNGVPATATQVLATPPPTALQDGVALPDRAGAFGSLTYYSFDVPSGPANRVLQVRIRGGTGDADLAIRLGAKPTLTSSDCVSLATTGFYNALDFCSVLSPDPGRWYIAIIGTESYQAVTLDARILPVTTLNAGVPLSGRSGGASDISYFEFGVPAGVAPPSPARQGTSVSGSSLLGSGKLGAIGGKGTWLPPTTAAATTTGGPQPVAGTFHVTTAGGTGDVDLWGSPRPTSPFGVPSLITWPCISFETTNNEVCDVGDPDAGPWTVLLIGFTAYSGVTLAADFLPPAPVISNARYTVVSINDAGLCANGGTKIDVMVDYTDPNGDVGTTVPFTAEFTFSPSGNSGTDTQNVTRNGTGDAGDLTAEYCVLFGTDTQLSLNVTITDAAGLQSNRLGLAIPKPAGANAPGAAPAVRAPAGAP